MEQFALADFPISYGRDIILREANGVLIRQRADNYFDATAMCRAYGKQFNDYRRLKDSTEFLDELAAVTGIPVTGLIISIQGGTPSQQGTWVHRRVAIDLARWCSPRFAVIVNGWIDDLLQSRPVNIAEARGIDPFVLDKLFAQQRDALTDAFDRHRQQVSEDIEIAVKTHVPKPRVDFTPATEHQIVKEWLRQNPEGLDPTGMARIVERVDGTPKLISGVGELHHMHENWRVGFRDGLPVWVPFHRKLTADRDRVGDEWRRAYNAHRHFLDKADAVDLFGMAATR